MTTPNDPMRALDQVEPASEWSDITRRAEGPVEIPLAPPTATRSKLRRPVLVAAAILAVFGLGTAVLVGQRDRKPAAVGSGVAALDPPAAIWGRTFRVVAIHLGGEDLRVVPGVDGPLRVDTVEKGVLRIRTCASIGGVMVLDGDRLRLPGAGDRDPIEVDEACGASAGGLPVDRPIGTFSSASAVQAHRLDRFLRAGMSIEARGEDVSLVGGRDDRIDLVDERSFEPAERAWGRTWEVTGGSGVVPGAAGDATVVTGERTLHGRDPIRDKAANPARFELAPSGDGTSGTVVHLACTRRYPVVIGGSLISGRSSLPDNPSAETYVGSSSGDRNPPFSSLFSDATPDCPQRLAIDSILRNAFVDLRGDRMILRSEWAMIELVDVTAAARAETGSQDRFWGRRWTVLERFDGGATALPVFSGTGGTPVFDTRTDEIVTFTGCNGAGARVRLDGDRLVQLEDLPHTLIGCAPDLLAQDDWFAALLTEGSTVTVDGNRLTLTTESGKRVELLDIEGSSDGSAATTTMPPGVTEPPSSGNTTNRPQSIPPVGPDSGDTSASPPAPGPGQAPPSGPVPTTTFPAIGQPADGKFFNHFWQVTAISDGGSDPGFDGAVVVASTFNEVTVAGCNGAGGAMRLDGDRLRVDGEWAHLLRACGPADGGVRLTQQDAWFDAFLRAEPTVSVSGRTATLTTSAATVRLRLP